MVSFFSSDPIDDDEFLVPVGLVVCFFALARPYIYNELLLAFCSVSRFGLGGDYHSLQLRNTNLESFSTPTYF